MLRKYTKIIFQKKYNNLKKNLIEKTNRNRTYFELQKQKLK
jgi:hypothetical protein